MKRLLLALLVLVLVALLFPVSNLLKSPPDLKLATAVPAPVAEALVAKCMDCHSSQVRMPFYSAFPVAGPLITADIDKGRRFIDLSEGLAPAAGEPVAETVLAKLEHTTRHDAMPPANYRLMHWSSALTSVEKQAVLGWVTEARKASYATADAPEEVKGQVLQPLPLEVKTDPAKVALGDKLYHDTRLSGDNTISCATCHLLTKGGTDQLPTSKGIRGQMGPINAPTVFNSGFMLRQFWDGRAADLQEQAAGPVENPLEMGTTWDAVITVLREDAELLVAVTAVYPEGISKHSVTDAIAEYERSLITPNSKFDRYLRGDAKALDGSARKGHQLFVDRACASCHVGKLLGGRSFERMGQHGDYFADRGSPSEADLGRFNFTKDEADKHFFKVPTLRNIALTQPYFHDGSKATLREAVQTMGRYQLEDPLSEDEISALVAFLEAQTGELNGKPL